MIDRISVHVSGAQPRVARAVFHFPGLAEGLRGKRLLFAADLHYSRWFPAKALDKLLSRIEELKPDLIVWGGDYAETQPLALDFARKIARFRPPLGMLAVPGNNDYENFDGDYALLRKAFRQVGAHLLVNSRYTLPVAGGRLIVSGLDDAKYGSPKPDTIAFKREGGDFHLLLAHSPLAIDAALFGAASLPEISLAGHTHGGQISPFGLSVYTLSRRGLDGPQGRYFMVSGARKIDGMYEIVSNGVGTSLFPLRVGAPPEIHLIELQSE